MNCGHSAQKLPSMHRRKVTRHFPLGGVAVFSGLILVLAACQTRPAPAPAADWLVWRAKRLESVAGTNGWTTLIGLHWLHEGTNTAGSAETNDVVMASSDLPLVIGSFLRSGTNVTFSAAPHVDARVEGERVEAISMINDASTHATRLQIGNVAIIVIQRGDRLGLRIRNPLAKTRRDFPGLKYFPYNPHWRLAGRYVPFPEPRKLRVPDVTGSLQEFLSPGELNFRTHDGLEGKLAVALEPDEPNFFILFRDATAGSTTYPAGRFLYVNPPSTGDDKVVIDFNRAYTPPCGFTPFATCPIPPQSNWLPFEINAGELKPVGH